MSNVLFAHYGLKEPLTKRDMIGTGFILCGSILSVAFGNHVEVTYTLSELMELYRQTGFIVYAIILGVVCLIFYIIIKLLQPIKVEMVEKCQEYENAIVADVKDNALIEELDLRIAELELKYEKWERIHPFTYCALSGCLGAQSILFGKMVRAARWNSSDWRGRTAILRAQVAHRMCQGLSNCIRLTRLLLSCRRA